jgi:hypothetical protein
MGRYTNPDDVKTVLNFAECAEIYGFPRAVRRSVGSGNFRLPVATPHGNLDRPFLPEPMASSLADDIMIGLHTLDDWGNWY